MGQKIFFIIISLCLASISWAEEKSNKPEETKVEEIKPEEAKPKEAELEPVASFKLEATSSPVQINLFKGDKGKIFTTSPLVLQQEFFADKMTVSAPIEELYPEDIEIVMGETNLSIKVEKSLKRHLSEEDSDVVSKNIGIFTQKIEIPTDYNLKKAQSEYIEDYRGKVLRIIIPKKTDAEKINEIKLQEALAEKDPVPVVLENGDKTNDSGNQDAKAQGEDYVVSKDLSDKALQDEVANSDIVLDTLKQP
jgi:hypothetical protein